MADDFDIHELYRRVREWAYNYGRFERSNRIADIALACARDGEMGGQWGDEAKVTDIEVLGLDVEDGLIAQITYVIRIHAECYDSGRECDPAVTITVKPQSPYDDVEAYARHYDYTCTERVLALHTSERATCVGLDCLIDEMVPIVKFLLGGKNV